METLKVWAARAFAAVGVTGLLAAVVAALFVGGEIRQGFRAACGARDAGFATRALCDWLDVVPPPPAAPVELADSDEAERAERYVAPSCTTAQALELLDHEAKDLAALERLLQRDIDGDGRTGSATRKPRPAPPQGKGSSAGYALGLGSGEPEPAPTGELVLADKNEPELPRGGRVVATVPVTGGPVRLDVIPNDVPTFERLHELTWQLAGDLPVNDHEFGDGIEASVRWDLARADIARIGLMPYWRRLSGPEAVVWSGGSGGASNDWGVKAVLTIRCASLFDCKAR